MRISHSVVYIIGGVSTHTWIMNDLKYSANLKVGLLDLGSIGLQARLDGLQRQLNFFETEELFDRTRPMQSPLRKGYEIPTSSHAYSPRNVLHALRKLHSDVHVIYSLSSLPAKLRSGRHNVFLKRAHRGQARGNAKHTR